jgi:threonine/homoserine/homoserine lactone efflux protein
MDFFLHWFIGVIVAFVAAAPLGPVNLAIVQTALTKGRSGALRMVAGSALIEMLYCLLAVWGTSFIFGTEAVKDSVMFWLKVGSIPLLFALGSYDIGKEIPRPRFHLGSHFTPTKGRGEFWLGFTLNLMNPVLLPFWLAISSYLRAHEWLEGTDVLLGTYGVGVAFGTFFIGTLITWITLKRNKAMRFRTRVYLSRGIGFLFLGFAVFQIFELIHTYIDKIIEAYQAMLPEPVAESVVRTALGV